jgi:trans-aconitate 2-methyltransferase
VDPCARRRQRVSLGRQEIEIITLARTDDPRPDIPPQQHAVIGRLPATAWIERGPVQNDALIGVSEKHSGAPFADRGVFEVEAVRVVPIRVLWRAHGCDSARIAPRGLLRRREGNAFRPRATKWARSKAGSARSERSERSNQAPPSVATGRLAAERVTNTCQAENLMAAREMTDGQDSDWRADQYGKINNVQEWLASRGLSQLRVRGDERVLDVGCGDGRVTKSVVDRLQDGSLVGIDPSTSMVEAARLRLAGSGRAVVELGEAATLGYHAEFDLVVSFNALHWELRWRQALHRIRDALRTGGRALLVQVCDGERPSLEDVIMQTSAAPRWSASFADFAAPFVHVAPDAYVAAATASRFAVDRADVDDLRWDFGSRAAFAAWCTAGMVSWTSRLATNQRQAFVDDVLSAYAKVSGSESVFDFLQFTVALSATE